MFTARLRRSDVVMLIAGSAIIFASGSVAEAAFNTTAWKNRQEVVVTSPGLTKLSLPEETLDLARRDLADLRLLGPGAQEIPFLTEIPEPGAPQRTRPKRFHVELQKLATQLTLETGSTGLIEGVQLETPTRDFVKAARLEISLDGNSWELVAEGIQLAGGRDFDQRTIRFNRTAAPFIRLTIDDWRTPIVPFTGATLLIAPPTEPPSLNVDGRITKREEFAGETVLTLELPARHLLLTGLELTVRDRIFSRSVRITERELTAGESTEQVVAGGFISRFQSSDQMLREQLRIALNVTTNSRHLEIHIQNDNNAPLAIEQAFVWRRPVWLTFNADAPGAYTILTGRADVTAPNYDLANFSADLRKVAPSALKISEASPNPGFEAPDQLAEAPLLGTAVDTSDWRFRRTVTPQTAGVHTLELDPHVLGHAQAGLGDLRLIRDGLQAPYLIERTSLLRPLVLSVSAADDPKRPRLSLWRVTLPLERLPIQRLALTTDTALFSRTVHVFETIEDSRGALYRRALSGAVQWDATPDRRERKRVIGLTAVPQTNVVEIEIDNGDNPPISLTGVQADYPVIRLLFRADAKPFLLYYGSEGAQAPSYDLRLVADRLLNQEKSIAALGPEEPLKSAPKLILSGIKSGIALWGALGLVVAVLLFVIARLLPKTPESTKH